MDLTRPESAGTDFTAFTTMTSILMVVCAGVGMALAGIFAVWGVVLLSRYHPDAIKPESATPPEAPRVAAQQNS